MLWECTGCTSAYSVGAPACPECGLTCDGAIERDDYMARVTVNSGVSDRLRPELRERGEDVSPGNSSSASPEKQPSPPKPSETPARKHAGKTASHSEK